MKKQLFSKKYLLGLIALFILSFITMQLNAQEDPLGVYVEAYDKTGQKRQASLYHKAYAVIVGINKYEKLPDIALAYAVQDAQAVKNTLSESFRFDNITTLYNENATKENIQRVFQADLMNTSKDDAIFVFLSGYCYTVTTPQYNDLGYFIPYNGTLESHKLYQNISIDMMNEMAKKLPAKHIFFVVNGCITDFLLKGGSSRETEHSFEYLSEVGQKNVRQILTAGEKDQIFMDVGPKGLSVFTNMLVDTFDLTRDFISAAELGKKVSDNVLAEARERGTIQLPTFSTLFGLGDFVFVRAEVEQAGNIDEEIDAIKEELREIERIKKLAQSVNDEPGVRESIRRQKEAEARLKIKELEKEAILNEEAAKQKLFEEQKHKQAEEKYLALLKQKLDEERRRSWAEPTQFTLIATIKELKTLYQSIEDITTSMQNEETKALKRIEEYYKQLLDKPTYGKDDFETEEEYKNRVKRAISEIKNNQEKDIKEIKEQYSQVIQSLTEPLYRQTAELTKKEFNLPCKLELLKYNPQEKRFPIKISYTLPGSAMMTEQTFFSATSEEARNLWQKRELLQADLRVILNEKGNIKSTAVTILDENGKEFVSGFTALGINPKGYKEYMHNQTEMIFIFMPSGSFKMGTKIGDEDEKPIHEVVLSDFFIGKYEVTQGVWQKIMNNNPSYFKNGDNYPVEQVTWSEANDFCRRTDLRLPTEAEWEYAAKGNTTGKYYWEDSKLPSDFMWYYNNSGGMTHPVGQKRPNSFGLYDTLGNVWEWCQDWFDEKYYNISSKYDPTGPMSGKYRILRGGAWSYYDWNCRTTFRYFSGPYSRNYAFGFRCVKGAK